MSTKSLKGLYNISVTQKVLSNVYEGQKEHNKIHGVFCSLSQQFTHFVCLPWQSLGEAGENT